MASRALGTDACLLAAHDRQPMPGLEKATHLHVPAGFLNAYPRVTVDVLGGGTVVGPAAGIACGTRCTGYVRAGHGGTLTPLPAPGWKFGGWHGACAGPGTCAVKGSAAFSVTATFVQVPAAAPPSPSASALPTRTGAQLYEYEVHLTYATVAAGQVEIVAGNVGQDDHELAIRDAGGTVLAQTGLLHPHDEATLDVALAPGTYSVFCPLPNHEALGMIATLTVQRS
jgi:plastocyanin